MKTTRAGGTVIRCEVSCEADVTRLVTAFIVMPALRGQDYEIRITSQARAGAGLEPVLRCWRHGGQRGATDPEQARRALDEGWGQVRGAYRWHGHGLPPPGVDGGET